MDPDEYTAAVKAVLAGLEPPLLTDTEMAAFVAEAVEQLAAVYPQPRRRPLFGVRAIAAAYGVSPRWIAAMYRSGRLKHRYGSVTALMAPQLNEGQAEYLV